MALIKTSLELALEKTANIHIDRDAIEQKELKTIGRKIAGAYIENKDAEQLKEALKVYADKKLEIVRRGIVDIFLSYVQIPIMADQHIDFSLISTGCQTLKETLPENKSIPDIFTQIENFLRQYLQDAKHLEDGIKKQFAPKIKQKEQEMRSRTGRDVSIDIRQDPEFIAFYNQNMGKLKGQYQAALEQAKEELIELLA